MPEGRTRLLLAAALALAITLLAAPAAHAGLLFPESGGSPNADSIKTLYVMVFVLALFIFAGVEGTLLWSLWRYRARKGRTAAQIHGNTKLEVGWTVGAAVILIFITAFTFIKLPAIKNPKPSTVDINGTAMLTGAQYAATDQSGPAGSMKIVVNGQQYVWRYSYPGRDRLLTYTDMVVPVGRDGRAGHHGRRRHPLMVDSQARRQDGRRPRLREQDVVPDPGGRDPRGRDAGGLLRPVRRALRPQPREHVRARDRHADGGLPALVRRRRSRSVKAD